LVLHNLELGIVVVVFLKMGCRASVSSTLLGRRSRYRDGVAEERRRERQLKAIQSVEAGYLVCLCHGRIVEDGIPEVVDCTAKGQHALTDVDDLGRAFAEDVHAQDLPRSAIE